MILQCEMLQKYGNMLKKTFFSWNFCKIARSHRTNLNKLEIAVLRQKHFFSASKLHELYGFPYVSFELTTPFMIISTNMGIGLRQIGIVQSICLKHNSSLRRNPNSSVEAIMYDKSVSNSGKWDYSNLWSNVRKVETVCKLMEPSGTDDGLFYRLTNIYVSDRFLQFYFNLKFNLPHHGWDNVLFQSQQAANSDISIRNVTKRSESC